MKRIEINEHFKKSYLTCGNTRDNFIFENCLNEFVQLAECSLKASQNGTQSCCIKITKDLEEKLESTLSQCENDIQRKIVARELFATLFMFELIKKTPQKDKLKSDLKMGLSDILSGDFEKTKKYIMTAPTPYDIENYIQSHQKIELNIFLYDIQNKPLQQAINNYISSRLPYSVKIFSNKPLASYLDQNKNRIEVPHDYMTINVKNFIKIENTKDI